MPDDRSVWIGTAWGALVGTAVGVVGFFLTRYPATKGMGVALFFVVPFAAGFAIGIVTRGKRGATISALLTAIVTITFLIAVGAEGLICAVVVGPLLMLMI